MDRRSLLRTALAGGVVFAAPASGLAQAQQGSINARMTGDISPVHDPCIIREKDTYYLFCTGGMEKWGLLPFRTSKDLVSWTWRGSVLAQLPDWAQKAVPGTRGASYDFCCRGADSSYYTVVGRAKAPDGPYVDRDGKPMMRGGGFLVLHADLDRTHRFKGPGGISILREPNRDYIVYHAYDADHGGAPTLRIQPLGWSADGWPVAL